MSDIPRDVTALPDLLHGRSRSGPVRERRPVCVDLLPPCNAGCGAMTDANAPSTDPGDRGSAGTSLAPGQARLTRFAGPFGPFQALARGATWSHGGRRNATTNGTRTVSARPNLAMVRSWISTTLACEPGSRPTQMPGQARPAAADCACRRGSSPARQPGSSRAGAASWRCPWPRVR